MSGIIRSGIGGWTYKPWRETFYPEDLRQKDELSYAASKLGTIEIDGTYYRLQKPATFASWAEAAPEGFQFAIKASRYCTNRKDLREAEEGIGKFLGQGLNELGDKLGPILWQFMDYKQFDADEFGDFLAMLPETLDGRPLRHALEVRHESFACAEFVDLARQHNAAIVTADSDKYPLISDQTADFSYCRLLRAVADIETGYAAGDLDIWADRAQAWSRGEAVEMAGLVGPATELGGNRDVYLYFINGAKERAPAAALAMIDRVGLGRENTGD